eukprot:scaffold1836_cov56-Phaeocystis_antarctica.AAC.1
MTKLATWRFGECVDPALCTVGATPSTGSCRAHTSRCSEVQRCGAAHREVQESAAQRERCCAAGGAEWCRGAVRRCGAARVEIRKRGPSTRPRTSTLDVRGSRVQGPGSHREHRACLRASASCVRGH